MFKTIAKRRREADRAVSQFNVKNPVGTQVRYWTGFREGDGIVSKTKTAAQVLGGHTAVVWVEGEASCISLSHIQPVEAAVA
jgi:hypothetical protein